MENKDKNITDKRVLLGGVLVVIGALLLLGSMNILDVSISHIIFSWPFIFSIVGLFILFNTNKKLLGGIFTGIGIFFLIERIFPQVHYHAGIVFPVILIALGVYIILNHRKKDISESEKSGFLKKDLIDDVSIFGGGSKIVASDNFRGGNITAVFGGSEINLTGCKLADGDQIIDMLLVFGGTTIVVPRDWNVVVNVTSILGGFSDKSIRDPGVIPDQSRTLYVKGLAMFGGGEVKNYI
jgi:predicted membrane protein